MEHRTRFQAAAVVWAAALFAITTPNVAAGASGLAYRDVSTGGWKGIAASGDTLAAGAFAGRKFASFSGKSKAPIESLEAGICGGSVVAAAFVGKVTGAAPNTGVFGYNAVNDTIIDVAIEGAPTPLGGTWKSFSGINPAIGIDPTSCTVVVAFRGQVSGLPGSSDTGIFLASFGLPGPFVIGAIAQEGVTTAPPPFPAAATFADFPKATSLDLKGGDPAGVGGAAGVFSAKVSGGGVTSADDTGIFAINSASPGIITVAREGDPACAPPWGGAGPLYDNFAANVSVGTGDSFGGPVAPVVFRGKSKGGAAATDTAIVGNVSSGPCVSNVIFALEGASTPSPLTGTYKNFASTTPLASAGGNASPLPTLAFLGGISGMAGTPKALFHNGGGSFGIDVLVTQGSLVTTAFGSAPVTLPGNVAPAVSPANPGSNTVFRAVVAGPGAGVFESGIPGPFPAESVGGGFRNPQIDRAGDITARYP